MGANGYRLLGFVVWHGGRWYVRRKLPARSALLGGVAVAALGTLAAAALLKRAGS